MKRLNVRSGHYFDILTSVIEFMKNKQLEQSKSISASMDKGVFPPSVLTQIASITEKGRTWHIQSNALTRLNNIEVRRMQNSNDNMHIVDWTQQTCSCKVFPRPQVSM